MLLTARLVRWLLRGLVRPDTLQVVLRSGVLTISDLEIRSPVVSALLALVGISLRLGMISTIEIALPWADALPSGDRIHIDGVRLILAPTAKLHSPAASGNGGSTEGSVSGSGLDDSRSFSESSPAASRAASAAIERLRRAETAHSGKHALAVLFTRLIGKSDDDSRFRTHASRGPATNESPRSVARV